MNKTTYNQWKPLQLDGSIFNSGAEGLVGIEECTDYDLSTVIRGKKGKKRKTNLIDQNVVQNKVPKKTKLQDTKNGKIQNSKKGKIQNTKKVGQYDSEEVEHNNNVSEDEVIIDTKLSPSKTGCTFEECIKTSIKTKTKLKTKKKSKNLDIKISNGSDNTEGIKLKSEKEASSVNVNGDVENVSDDIDLECVKSWTIVSLPESLLKALAHLKFFEPTQIQSLTLPPAILGKRDILGAAETGSGKTLAFGLPILTGILNLKEKESQNVSAQAIEQQPEPDYISDNLEAEDANETDESDFEEREEVTDGVNQEGIGCVRSINNIQMEEAGFKKPLYALILTPTRELAIQIRNHLVAAARFTDIRVAVIVGGMAVEKQERILNKGPEIVVATPGRLWELIQEGNPHLSQINDVKYLTIDETDRMIERGHFQELHDILERINMDEEKKKQRQNFVFSATLTLVHELPKHLVTKKKIKLRSRISDLTATQKLQKIVEKLGITNPKCIDITQGKGTSGTLTECRITCTFDEKDYYVYYFLQKHPGRTLVFCNSIGCVKRLSTILGLLGCSPLPLHASMQQRQRLKNLDRFKANANGLLIATDVAARGLDIPCVEHVIHYQTPRTGESYIHRSGRTARASREGITVLLVEPSELQSYLRLCRTLEKTEDIPLFPVQANMLRAVKDRVNLARELDKLELQLRKTNSEAGWMQKAASEMDIILDEQSCKYNTSESHAFKKAADVKRKELTQLLAKPLFPRGFSGKYPLGFGELDVSMIQGEQKVETAIGVMKLALENNTKRERKRPKALFKPKIKKQAEDVNLKLRAQQMHQKNKQFKRHKNQKNRKR